MGWLSLPSMRRRGLVVALVLAGGCDGKGKEEAVKQPTAQQAADALKQLGAGGQGGVAAAQEVAIEQQPFRELWEAHYIQDSKIGHAHTTYLRVKLNGEPLVKIERRGKFSVQRLGQKVESTMREVSWETEAGEVRRMQFMALMGESPQTTLCLIEGQRATLNLIAGDKTTSKVLEWKPGTRGPFGVQDELMRNPMKLGETRELTAILPMVNNLARVTLTARGKETTTVGSKPRELLKIDVVARIEEGGMKIQQIAWIDEQGNPVKSEMPDLQQSTILTTAAVALAEGDNGRPAADLGRLTLVNVANPPSDLLNKTAVRYRATVRAGEAGVSFESTESQTVKSLPGGAAEINVVALRPDTPLPPGYIVEPATPAELASNSLVEADEPLVAAMARRAVGAETDPWLKAVALERFVRESMRSTEFSAAMGSAAETAKSLTGDCTEFAVLLCALLRANGIPARGAVGLVYFESEQAFAYHMWTEAFIGGRWIGLDGTRGTGGLSAAYLRIADLNFSGADPVAGLMRIFGVVGRLQVEVLEAK